VGVRFQLLGAVECSAGGIPLAIGHPRQRSVLAVLLVEANRPVRTELLIDRVWGDTPPNQARAVLSSYVSRLRGSFDAIPDEAKRPSLIRRSGGYALHVDPDQVDLHLFRRLVIRSQRLDDAQAAELLSEALALWRGVPFEDADSPWLHDLRQTLEQERLASVLRANDIALANGRHAQLVGSLHHMHARQPHDERLAGQLMLALYRCGRAADALNTYLRMRTRLVDELGIEPGPVLQDLHQRMLAAEPSLGLPAAASRSAGQRPPGGSVPAQLPADIRAFIGRTQYLRQLDELAAEHSRETPRW